MADDEPDEPDEWDAWWLARADALESILGPMDDMVGHASIPFDVGADLGGAPDLVFFNNHVQGIVAVTAELIGRDDQVENSLGNYELMICGREDIDWGADLISGLAYYTLRAKLEPGETMDLGEAGEEDSTIVAFLFCDYGRFEVRGRRAGLLLCLGITAEELAACRGGKKEEVLRALQSAGIYPFTDLYRPSVALPD